ncbi:MAG: invasion associated locus B family protein [Pseudomonadota bacterium]
MAHFTMKTAIAAAAVSVMAGTALAQTPTPIKQHKAWGAYSYQDQKAGKICYVLSIPTLKEPTDRDHGDVFFLVSQKPNDTGKYEPQVEVGYKLKEKTPVTVTVDGKDFKMFSRGNNAWLEDVSQEPALVQAMRDGRSMKVSGQSARGTNTTYTYSLSGVTAALSEVANCK